MLNIFRRVNRYYCCTVHGLRFSQHVNNSAIVYRPFVTLSFTSWDTIEQEVLRDVPSIVYYLLRYDCKRYREISSAIIFLLILTIINSFDRSSLLIIMIISTNMIFPFYAVSEYLYKLPIIFAFHSGKILPNVNTIYFEHYCVLLTTVWSNLYLHIY